MGCERKELKITLFLVWINVRMELLLVGIGKILGGVGFRERLGIWFCKC